MQKTQAYWNLSVARSILRKHFWGHAASEWPRWLRDPGQTMTLHEVIRDINTFDEGNTIYAAEPWTADSQAIIAPEPEAGGLPAEAQKLGLKYFLEVFVARDFLDGWLGNLRTEPTPQERCARLIQYAMTDA